MKTSNTSIVTAVLIVAVLIGGAMLAQEKPKEVQAQTLEGVEFTFYRSPTCGCCAGHAQALEDAGATVHMNNVDAVSLQKIKEEHGVSFDKQSCHTALVDDYVIEGHVPVEAIAEFLAEQPDTKGITLPGMPIGTPGMPGPQREPYIVETLEGELYWTKDPA